MRFQLLPNVYYSIYDIEPDMYSQPFDYEEWDSIEKYAYLLWHDSAIVGICELPPEIRDALIVSAKSIIRKLIKNPKLNLLPSDIQVFSLALIEIAKEFDDDTSGGGFWERAYDQLGFCSEEPDAPSTQQFYIYARTIFRDALHNGKKFYADEGHKYYNSIYIHSMAPGWAIEHLINILFGFYSKNLEYHYEIGDEAFHIFVQKICERWEERKGESDRDLKLRSDALSSGLRLLFKNRPKFMAALCDYVIGKIDALLKGDYDVIEKNNRLDTYLKKWYDAQSDKEHLILSEKRRDASAQKVARNKSEIKPWYHLDDNEFYLTLPRIRLPEISQQPMALLYQGETLIDTKRLHIFGDLCLTTHELDFHLSSALMIRWNQNFQFRIKIMSGDQEIYDSTSSLFRSYIIFDRFGSELYSPKPGSGTIFLLAQENSIVDIVCDDDSYFHLNHNGQLYEVPLAVTQQVRVDGQSIFHVSGERSQISAYLSKQEEKNIYVRKDGVNYSVFTSPILLYVSLPTNDMGKNYQVFLDSACHPLSEYMWSESRFEIPLPRMPRYCHTIRIKEFSTGKTISQFCYIILTDFSCEFDKPIYKNISSDVNIKIRIGGSTVTKNFILPANQEELEFPLWDGSITAVIQVPKLTLSLLGQNLFLMEPLIWYGDIEKDWFITARVPHGMSVSIQLGGYAIPKPRKNIFEIGNFLSSRTSWPHPSLPLGIILSNGNEIIDQLHLGDVVFQAHFTDCPIVTDGKKICWAPDGKYLGPTDSEFYVKLYHNQGDPFVYAEKTKFDVMEKRFPYNDGYYDFEVLLREKRNIFTTNVETIIYSGKIKIGDPNISRWERKELHLTNVHYWSNVTGQDEVSPLFKRDGFITDIEYIGLSIPSVGNEEDSEICLPEYRAYLQYQKFDGSRYDYNYKPYITEYELINPIRLWVTSDNRLLIETSAGEGTSLMISTKKPVGLKEDTVRIVFSLQKIPSHEHNKFVQLVDSFDYEEIDIVK